MDDAASYAALGGVSERGRVVHFGDPEAETALALEGAAATVTPLATLTPLRVTGADRAAFLHGQLSNRVQGLRAGESNPTLQLNVRGQVVGEGVLCVRPDDVYLAVDDGRGPSVRASLEQHIVFDDVTLEDLSGTLVALSVQGRAAAAVVERLMGALPEPGRFLQAGVAGAEVLALPRRRSAAGGYDLHLRVEGRDGVLEALRTAGAVPVGQTALDAARVAAGVPSAAADGGEHALPQELGLDAAVATSKGCYLGQEIMARIEARGAVRRRLATLALEGAGPALQALVEGEDRAVRLDGREVGRLGTVARFPDGRWHALALLRRDLPGDAELRVGGASARLAPAAPAAASTVA